jgi:predicted phosphodiesterase
MFVAAQAACVTSGHFPESGKETVEASGVNGAVTAATAAPGATPTSAEATAPEPTAAVPEPTAAVPEPTAAPTATTGLDYFSRSYPASQVSYVIPLSVRHVTGDRASLFFELNEAAEGRLVYRSLTPGIASEGAAALDPGQKRQSITLEGLVPGAAYQAKVLLGSEAAGITEPQFAGSTWGAVSFQTASNTPPLRVGILGDASFGDEATTQLVNLMASQELDFVIHTGDVVYETDSSDLVNSYVRNIYLPFEPLLKRMPVYTVLGNHDYDAVLRWEGAPFYDTAFPPFEDPAFSYPESRRANQYYAVAYQGVQFLFLDSQTFYGVEGRADQKAWLEERLADEGFRFTIPVFHVAPYSSSVVHPDDGIPVQQTWNPLFSQFGVPVSFSGHFHHYERLNAYGVTYIVSGGGSSVLYAQGEPLPESQVYIRMTHFVLMEIDEEEIRLSAISKEGELLDQAVIPID